MAGGRSHRRWSIRAKSAALVVGYLLALGGVYAAFTVSLLRRAAVEAQERLEQTARIVAAELDAYVESGTQRLAMVSRLPGMTHGLRTIQEASGEGRIPPWTTLHYLFFKSPVFTGGAFLLDRTGKVLWSEPPGRQWVGRSLAEDPTIAGAYRRKQAVVSRGRQADDLLDRPHVLVAIPVVNPSGEIDGALGGIIDLTAPEFAEMLHAVSRADGRFVDVVDQNDRVIAASDPARVLQAHTALSGTGEWMQAATALTHAPWQVVAGQPRSLALAEVRRFQQLLLGLGLGLLVIALAVGAPSINRFSRAIATLTGAADTMARGDLSRPVAVRTTHHEIETLAHTLEQMRIELERSRRALEQRLGEREELMRLREVFLANVSHELRTPLNAIVGYTDMLSDEPLSADGRDFVRTIRRQSEHLFQLVTDLLTLSALNTERIRVQLSPVHVPNLLQRLKPLAEQLRAGNDVEIVWDCAVGLPTIETDALRLEQVITHLISNALKFTQRGRVTIRVRHAVDAGRITFEVLDTGIGIPEPEMAYIFDEFRQVDGSDSRPYGGVGLGLALVKKVAMLLEGEITVQSQVGVGSTFTLSLPLQPAMLRAAQIAARDAASAA